MNALFYELPLIFISGVLGSAHCIGMCGAISAMMNMGTSTISSALTRQVLWSLGRTFTYTFLGMVAGFAGVRLSRSQFLTSQTSVVSLQAGFAVLAGLLLVFQGMLSAGWFRRKVSGSHAGCLTASIFGKFLRGGSKTGVFIAGILTGFLPCGLVYSFLALAAASASVWKGPLLMLAFGMGTVPVMLVTGAGLTMASLRLRQRLMKLAAVCVILTGVLTIGRGIAFATNATAQSPQKACPLCEMR
ncbi:MAG: sulfite exporter TauE/SafE family protein [Planctomycetaceae bacterium]